MRGGERGREGERQRANGEPTESQSRHKRKPKRMPKANRRQSLLIINPKTRQRRGEKGIPRDRNPPGLSFFGGACEWFGCLC